MKKSKPYFRRPPKYRHAFQTIFLAFRTAISSTVKFGNRTVRARRCSLPSEQPTTVTPNLSSLRLASRFRIRQRNSSARFNTSTIPWSCGITKANSWRPTLFCKYSYTTNRSIIKCINAVCNILRRANPMSAKEINMVPWQERR